MNLLTTPRPIVLFQINLTATHRYNKHQRVEKLAPNAKHCTTTVIRRVDDSDVQNHGKWRFTGMNLLLKAVLNISGPGQYIRQGLGASKRTHYSTHYAIRAWAD